MKQINIPSEFIFPSFHQRKNIEDEDDIFIFDHRTVEEVWFDVAKTYFREHFRSVNKVGSYLHEGGLWHNNCNKAWFYKPEALFLGTSLATTVDILDYSDCIFKREFVRRVLKENEVSS